jgi:hypothetical protein
MHQIARQLLVLAVASMAAVALGGGGWPEPTALTDVEGRFVFRGLAAGTYRLATSVGGNSYSPNGFIVTGIGFPIGGYLNGGFGQRRPHGPLQPIDLAEGHVGSCSAAPRPRAQRPTASFPGGASSRSRSASRI